MPKLKLTKAVAEAAEPQKKVYDLRDTSIPGLLLKVTPAGRKIFMLAYVAHNGQRRKPSIGRFGEITVEQARKIAQDWLAEVRNGKDSCLERRLERRSPTMKDLFERFMAEYSEPRNKPSTVRSNWVLGNAHLIPRLGKLKVGEVTRPDVAELVGALVKSPTSANRVLGLLHKMFNMAVRPDGSNPCRLIPKYPQRGYTRLITDAEMKRLFAYLNRAEAEGLEHLFIFLAIRLQFEFAARMSEIINLEWAWVDFEKRIIEWPDSKTGAMSKPMSGEAIRLLMDAPSFDRSAFVCPSIFDMGLPMSKQTYYHAWRRVLARAGLPHIGTHGIRHRSATDIANSGVPLKVGMVLTAHKTATMFMRYVPTEDDQVRAAAEDVGRRRQNLVKNHQASNPLDALRQPMRSAYRRSSIDGHSRVATTSRAQEFWKQEAAND